MFAIIISEKGGPERRETFDKAEINVGRVQGNDLTLPKGNVSKHHARLLFRDGRFIVTDLKSTNGTYVNGRKIAQATIVREGDKIYIGDFVIRLDAPGAIEGEPPSPGQNGGVDESTLAREREREHEPPPQPPQPIVPPIPVQAMPRPAANGPAVTLKASMHPAGARPVAGRAEPPAVQPVDGEDDSEILKPMRPLGSQGAIPPRQQTAPLNASSPPQILRAGGPPPLPSEFGPGGPPPLPGLAPIVTPGPMPAVNPTAERGLRAEGPPQPVARVQKPSVPPVVREVVREPPPAGPPRIQPREPAGPREPAVRDVSPAARQATVPPELPREAPRDGREPGARESVLREPPKKPATVAIPGRGAALRALAARVAEAVDLAPLRSGVKVPDALSKRLEAAARDQAKALQAEGALPQGVDPEVLARELHIELTGLGVLGPLLDVEDVSQVHAQRFDRVVIVRGGASEQAEVPFSSEDGLFRVVQRLAEQSGEPIRSGETLVERTLPGGVHVYAVLPPVAKSTVLTVRKGRPLESSLEQLARQNVLSRPMAVFLEALVLGRFNVLVVGASATDGPSLLAALVSACVSNTTTERIAVVEDDEEIVVPRALLASFRRGGDADDVAVRAAVRTRPERLVVTRLAGRTVGATIDAIGEGCESVLAALPAVSLRQGLGRLTSQLMLQRPGLSPEGAREVVADAFDAVVELGASQEGRRRVVRIAELGVDPKGLSTKDTFTFNEGDSSFSPTGNVPRVVAELGARGVKIDGGIFRKGAK